jgi:hypothetical protein
MRSYLGALVQGMHYSAQHLRTASESEEKGGIDEVQKTLDAGVEKIGNLSPRSNPRGVKGWKWAGYEWEGKSSDLNGDRFHHSISDNSPHKR